MNIFDWLEKNQSPRPCHSGEFIYDDMESQSDRCLPLLYQPFDVNRKMHWCDRGMVHDFLHSTGGGKLLDFGPGDGWPALIVAPFTEFVTGVDASPKRVEVCFQNARKLDIENVEFLHVPAGERLPFDDDSFDGVVASSSIEQTPDPRATLDELYRILRPGGRVRIFYEALGRYRGGQERAFELLPLGPDSCRLILYDRHIDDEYARQYGLTLAMSAEEARAALFPRNGDSSFENITTDKLHEISDQIRDVRSLRLTHPSGRTLVSWMKQIGFNEIRPTHNGGDFAAGLFDSLPAERKPHDMTGIDRLLADPVRVAVAMSAPIETDPMITAVK